MAATFHHGSQTNQTYLIVYPLKRGCASRCSDQRVCRPGAAAAFASSRRNTSTASVST